MTESLSRARPASAPVSHGFPIVVTIDGGLVASSLQVLTGRRVRARRAIAATSAATATIAVGAALGTTLFPGLSNAGRAGVLAFGCAALLSLVTEELLNDASECARPGP